MIYQDSYYRDINRMTTAVKKLCALHIIFIINCKRYGKRPNGISLM